ncbi:MAG: diguanylate cyclase [Acidiferrobacterales bacterium]
MQTIEQAQEKARVLVVDDSRVMRLAVQRVLGKEFDLVEAEDGEAGWDTLRADSRIQVVISDVQMPRLDGYSLICRIRAADESRIGSVPVVVITGAEDEITRERAFACGANDFITKPIDSAQLLACVRNLARPDQDAIDVAETVAVLGDQSNIDSLTHLDNRRHFFENSRVVLGTAQKTKGTLSLLRLSVDNFIALRAQYGDEYADHVLIWVANILRAKTRKGDLLARTGNSEFAAVTLSSGRVESAVLCERLRSAVSAKPFSHEGITAGVTVSIGLVSLGHDPGDSLEDLLALAHKRLKAASSAGGDRMCVSEEGESHQIEEAVIEQPGLDEALKMLARNELGQLELYAAQLAASVIPLLEFCNKRYSMELDYEMRSIKEALSRLG